MDVNTYAIRRENLIPYEVHIPTSKLDAPFITPASHCWKGGIHIYIYKQFDVKLWDENEDYIIFKLTLRAGENEVSDELWIPRGSADSTILGMFSDAQRDLAMAALIYMEDQQ